MKHSTLALLGLVLLQIASTQAFFISLGTVGMGVFGLAALKLYYGMKLLGPALRSVGFEGLHGRRHSVDIDASQFPDQDDDEPDEGTDEATDQQHDLNSVRDVNNRKAKLMPIQGGETNKTGLNLTMPVVLPDKGKDISTIPMAIRVRRGLPAPKLNREMFSWLNNIDDEKCFHRFFCDLGANSDSFGIIGKLTNMVIMMGGLPEGSWPTQQHQRGREQGATACPSQCNGTELQKTVDYIERHVFEQNRPRHNPHRRTFELKQDIPVPLRFDMLE